MIGQRLLAALLLLIAPAAANAQFNTGGGGGGGSGVTSVTPGCGTTTSPNPIIHTGSVGTAIPLTSNSPVTGAAYTIQASDACGLLVLNAGASVLTLPDAATSGFGANNYWYIDNQSGGDITINVTSPSNLDGSATVTIVNGTAFSFQSDGTDYHFVAKSAPGIGTVTSLTGSCGILTSPSPITNAGVITGSATPTIITASNPPITSAYCGGIVYLNGGTDLAPTIAQAGSAGFPAGYNVTVCTINAAQTLSATGGTIASNGASYTIGTGTAVNPVCVGLISDGISDYKLVTGSAGTVIGISAGCGSTTQAGEITTTGVIASTEVSVAHVSGDTINTNECGGLGTFNSGSAVAITLPQAGSTGFPAGWFEDYVNYGVGLVTFTTSTSHFLTAGSPSTYALTTGQGVRLVSSTASAGNWDVANAGSSPGIISSVANSDGTLTISPTTGSVVASIALGHANTWTGTQTFGPVLGTETTQTTTYTFVAADCGKDVRFTNSGAITATIDTTLPVGCHINVIQRGAGKVSVNGTAVTACTLTSARSYTGTSGTAGSVIGITMDAANTCILTGDGS